MTNKDKIDFMLCDIRQLAKQIIADKETLSVDDKKDLSEIIDILKGAL